MRTNPQRSEVPLSSSACIPRRLRQAYSPGGRRPLHGRSRGLVPTLHGMAQWRCRLCGFGRCHRVAVLRSSGRRYETAHFACSRRSAMFVNGATFQRSARDRARCCAGCRNAAAAAALSGGDSDKDCYSGMHLVIGAQQHRRGWRFGLARGKPR